MKNPNEQEIRTILSNNLSSTVDFNEVSSDESLSKLGFNSVDFIKVAVELETAFEIIFGDEDLDFDNFDTIDNIVKFINERSSKQ